MKTVFDWSPEEKAMALQALERCETEAVSYGQRQRAMFNSVRRVGIVGGGTMGAGIAVAMLNAGYLVQIVERDEAAANAGRQRVLDILSKDLGSGRIDHDTHSTRLASFGVAPQYDVLNESDLVIEAVYENLDVKRRVFDELDQVCRETAILATNTSYLDPTSIFSGVSHSERCIGLHFFSPANIMKLVEVIPTRDTSDQTLATAFQIVGACRKIPVKSGICEGFIGNRILKTMRQQAERVLLFGALPEQVDAALRTFGMKMGPFEVQDLAGLDIAAHQRIAARERGQLAFGPISDRLFSAGRLGQKSGAGWYDYDGSSRKPGVPEKVQRAIDEARTEAKTHTATWPDEVIVETILFCMLDEAAKILQEGIAAQQCDIDLVQVHGYGFPREKGGLLVFGTNYGLSKVVGRLKEFNDLGLIEPPSSAMLRLADCKA
ncbi:3-hydroxyacyl-CoA dehydrogenase family protein [Roseinatronobacter sp. NSM]|uniref:3-hydroxyacyl-CoA dehydrogenase family protein n=1 Tax=Roseinatronobacter sp. NSM TaxID=3457785 RepID=UPI004036A91B